MASRVSKTGLVELLMASEIATQVAEFLERSPTKTEKSAESTNSFKSEDLSKEPESVAGRKVISGKGGTLFLRVFGRRMFNFFIGKDFDKYSEVWMTVEKLPEFPPTMLKVPVFCSGIFQERSEKSLRSGFFCQ